MASRSPPFLLPTDCGHRFRLATPLFNQLRTIQLTHPPRRNSIHQPREKATREDEKSTLCGEGYLVFTLRQCAKRRNSDLLGCHAAHVIDLEPRLAFEHVAREICLRQPRV